MWADLGLATEADASCPAPLAHERVAERVPGSGDASRACAERARALPSFSETSTTLGENELRHDLELQRFLRRDRPSENDSGQEGFHAAPYIGLMVNFDLRRRKAFWVDAGPSFMLENTDLDVAGEDHRAAQALPALTAADAALGLGVLPPRQDRYPPGAPAPGASASTRRRHPIRALHGAGPLAAPGEELD